MDIAEIKNKLQSHGVVGAGGAGFPAYAKLAEGADIILLNCAECEPLLTLHRQLLAEKAVEILKAFSEIGKALKVKQCIIGIKHAYTNTLDALRPIVQNFENVSIKELREIYPAGDEVILIYEATGRIVKAGGLPIQSGVIVYNVETMYNIYRALFEDKPVTQKLVTVTGEVKNPCTFFVPVGMTVKEAVAFAGGSKIDHHVYISGGAMMGNPVTESDVITKTTNAILVLPEDHLVSRSKRRNLQTDLHRAESACCQCQQCTELCPRNLLGHPIDPARFMRAVTTHNRGDMTAYLDAQYCSSCGVCETYACMQGLSPRALLAECKKQLRAKGIKPEVISVEAVRAGQKERAVPVKRLQSRLDLEKYEGPAVLTDRVPVAKKVRIPLSQHIGAPAVPAVKDGDQVKIGGLIAKPAKGLSVGIHASVSGRVILATEREIILESEGRV